MIQLAQKLSKIDIGAFAKVTYSVTETLSCRETIRLVMPDTLSATPTKELARLT